MIVDVMRGFLERNRISGPLLVAASGGIDSTALVIALAELGSVEFSVAHVNHRLRGNDSDADEEFVRRLCERHRLTLHVAEGLLREEDIRRSGIETAARKARYERLHEIRRKAWATYIVTAHQKNDQAETVLMRLLTGGGLAALRGIHPIRDDGVIRPLLTIRRAAIESYLAERNVVSRIDRSNADPRFLRNRVRTALTQLDGSGIDALAAIADQAREQWHVFEKTLDRLDSSVATSTETRFATLPEDLWLRRALLHRHIHRLDPGARDVSAADLGRLAAQMDSVKRVSVTASLEMIRRGDEVVLRRRPQATPRFEFELHAGESVYIPQIASTISIRRPATGDRQPFQLPRGADDRFTIRNRRDGDRFQPLGMAQDKKLKDFLIDRKIPAEARDRIPLLVWNGTIVWVAGVEISEAFKVRNGAGELYGISFEKESQEGVQPEADRKPDR